jgi:limonene-1,2-epoxide hydrolase
MSRTDAGSVATRILQGWTTGDFDTVRSLIHDDVTFVGPLGTTDGAEEFVAGLQRMTEMVKSAEVQQVIVDGEHVCVIYDLITETSAGTVPTAGWYQVRDGRLAAQRVYFDPRPLLH